MARWLSSRAFRGATRHARRVVTGGAPAGRLLDAASQRLKGRPAVLRGLLADVATLVRLVRAALGRRYHLPVRLLVTALAALIYFVNPLDLIPDAILGLGLLDDAAVLGWAISRLRKDLEAFREWESGRGETITVEAVDVSSTPSPADR
ncbi:MAG TPA: DUF1232 domain-containing protein [Thermoanaerobaculaceae bacterium]|nr:DUF1232 domain-containing protein [Thermoanaerobaculaceae bacterium]HPS78645.1 DUF1232 domain-containing protein [Thermoanaerobaculaceae bacterium]